jgi:His-Xaa-Ser system radical SAM maturase HxsC
VLDRLRNLLKVCKTKLPATDVLLLTNGRRLKDIETVKEIVSVRHSSLTFCVSLQADVDEIHDRIMGIEGAFADTVAGLHNLALLRQQVEIRVVIMRENYRRLPMLAEYIYRNMPFVCHVALMGAELTGLAVDNISRVWIDPADYAPLLTVAVRNLHRRALRVSIYNLPFCLLPLELWSFARDSISDWKKTFLPECSTCAAKDTCPGLFATSAVQSPNIRPVAPIQQQCQ